MLQDPVTTDPPAEPQSPTDCSKYDGAHHGALCLPIQQEHRRKIGVPYPGPNEEMPEDMEVEISRLAAAGAQKLLQANQAMMAQQQAQQAAQDPIVQMQQQELQLKAGELQRKAAKDQMDAQLRMQQQQIEQQRIASQTEIEGAKLGAQIAKEQDPKRV
jgi:hypothetical protein